jgi:anti-sigma factor RsiW
VNCEQAANLLSARLDDEIAGNDLVALEAHLGTCSACRATADAMSTQDVVLTAAFAPHRHAATALADRVIAQLQSQPPATSADRPNQNRAENIIRPHRSFWTNWGRPLLAAAAGFSLAILLTRPWDKPTNSQVVIPTTATAPIKITPPIAQLALATGAVFVCPSGSDQWRALETGGPVQPGMKIRTGSKVRCEFQMTDGSQVRLNADTQVTLIASRQVDVSGGQVFSSVRHQPDSAPFIVKSTPASATLTALGTAFDMTCNSAQTTCTVVEGSVKMESAGNQNIIKGGETLTLADGRFSEKKPVENLMRATQWVDEILVLKGRDDPELTSRINDIFAQLGHEKMWYMDASEVRRLGDHCVIPLTRYIQSDRSNATQMDEMKRREAARIIGDVATTWAIPELINLLADADGDVRYPAARALQRLTGQNLGSTPEEWRDHSFAACTPSINKWHTWWNENKSHIPGTDPDAVKPIEVVNKIPEPKGKG